jgi:hypothetical protein
MKRIIFIILPILYLACANSTEPDPIPKIFLSPASATVTVGNTIDLNIVMEENQTSFFAVSMQITHNNTLLNFDDINGFNSGSLFDQSAIAFAQNNGTVIHLSVTQVKGQTSTSGSGVIGTIRLTATSAGNSPIRINQDELIFYNAQGNEINIPDLEIEAAAILVQQ